MKNNLPAHPDRKINDVSLASFPFFHIYDKTMTAAALNDDLLLTPFQDLGIHFQMSGTIMA